MLFLAFNPLQPIITGLTWVLDYIHHFIPSLGWSLIVFAGLVRLAFTPLAAMQFKSMAEMQKVQPLLKALQVKHKGEPQKLQQEQMALYKEHGVNPFASCLPLLLQMPILFSLYWAIIARSDQFKSEHFLWIGSALSAQYPKILAANLFAPDYIFLGLYVVSMYFSVRFGSPPSTDPQAAQTQKIMSFMSPVFIAWFGHNWSSALIVYWFSANLFTMAQQVYFFRKFGLYGAKNAALAPVGGALKTVKANGSTVKNVTPPAEGDGKSLASGKNGSQSKNASNGSRSKRRAKR